MGKSPARKDQLHINDLPKTCKLFSKLLAKAISTQQRTKTGLQRQTTTKQKDDFPGVYLNITWGSHLPCGATPSSALGLVPEPQWLGPLKPVGRGLETC